MTKRTQYPIHDDFKKLKNLNPPLNPFLLPVIQKTVSLLWHFQKSTKTCEVKNIKIPFDKKTIKALLYSPKNIEENCPCLIYFHGGGFVFPPAPYHYSFARFYAENAKCKVIFVDYPLSPKKRFPFAVNACYTCFEWTLKNAESLSINKNKIAVGGDSAGGNLASVVSMIAGENNNIKPCCQMLIYPAVGSGNQTKSMLKYTDTPMCNSKDYEKYCDFYFDLKTNGEEKILKEKLISPTKASSFDIFPPTYIETAEFDCLKDEAVDFAKQLKQSNIPVVLNNTKQTIHAYDIVKKSPITQNRLNKRVNFLKKYFKN